VSAPTPSWGWSGIAWLGPPQRWIGLVRLARSNCNVGLGFRTARSVYCNVGVALVRLGWSTATWSWSSCGLPGPTATWGWSWRCLIRSNSTVWGWSWLSAWLGPTATLEWYVTRSSKDHGSAVRGAIAATVDGAPSRPTGAECRMGRALLLQHAVVRCATLRLSYPRSGRRMRPQAVGLSPSGFCRSA